MALNLENRVQQTGTANTTVSFTLVDLVQGFQSFAIIGDGNTTYYTATDTTGSWEVGVGTYATSGPTLNRTTILTSSNSNAAVTFSGTVTVFVTYPSEKAIYLDESGNASALGTITSALWNGSTIEVDRGGTGLVSSGAAKNVLVSNGTAWVSQVFSGATGGGSDEVFIQNSRVVTVNYTIPTGKSASCVGPLTVNSGITLTVASGERLVVL